MLIVSITAENSFDYKYFLYLHTFYKKFYVKTTLQSIAMKTIYEIERMQDGTFTSRIVSVNGKLTFSNHQVDTKQAAYKNLATNIKAMAKSIGVEVFKVSKTRNENTLVVDKLVCGKETYKVVTVKEINC